MRKLRIALALIAILLAFGVCAQAKSVTLIHSFQPGQIDKYKMTIDMRLSAPGIPQLGNKPVHMKMTSTFRQKVLGILPDGSARVLMSYGAANMSCKEFPNMPRQRRPAGSMTVTFTKDGRIADAQGFELQNVWAGLPGFDPSGLSSQMGYMGIFPSEPIEVGQSWANEMPLPFDSGTVRIVSTLLGAAVPVGKDVACKIRQDFQAYMDLGALTKFIAASGKVPMGEFKPSGGMQMTGWSVLYFSPDKSRLLKINGKVQADFSIEMPALAIADGAPQTLTMKMIMNISIARV